MSFDWLELPEDRANDTPQDGNHPSDHNVAIGALNQLRGIQWGTITNVQNYLDGNGRMTVTFPEPYASTPTVLTQGYRLNTSYWLDPMLNGVTSTGFTIRHWTGSNGGDIYLASSIHWDMYWVAFGELA